MMGDKNLNAMLQACYDEDLALAKVLSVDEEKLALDESKDKVVMVGMVQTGAEGTGGYSWWDGEPLTWIPDHTDGWSDVNEDIVAINGRLGDWVDCGTQENTCV